jgi:hypothetical protein
LMLIFCLLDRRLHKMSHGWQGTGKRIALALAEAINDPSKDVSFPRYHSPAERTAQCSACNRRSRPSWRPRSSQNGQVRAATSCV